MPPANDGKPWTREQLILAFELYCRIPFQRTNARDSRVKELADILGRTPASIARKLGNFGAFDPQLAERNISGLRHGSKLDKAIWDEFHQDWSGLIIQAHEIMSEFESNKHAVTPSSPRHGPSERTVLAKQRLHQSFFREAVLSSYNSRCCVTGLPIAECLVAGHIIPWSVDERRRADPTNGVCLSATFDRLFDAGLVTIKDDLTLHVSNRLRKLEDRVVARIVLDQHGQKITPPTRFRPDPACLRWHREHLFQVA